MYFMNNLVGSNENEYIHRIRNCLIKLVAIDKVESFTMICDILFLKETSYMFEILCSKKSKKKNKSLKGNYSKEKFIF